MFLLRGPGFKSQTFKADFGALKLLKIHISKLDGHSHLKLYADSNKSEK